MLAVLAASGMVLGSSAACSSRAEPNEILLYYKAGAGDNRQFEECIAPGKAGSYPVDDDVFALPTDKRTWNIQPTPGADDTTPITSGSLPKSEEDATGKTVTRPGPAVHVWLTTDFFLNWDCDLEKNGGKGQQASPVVQFFERTGRGAQISSDMGEFNLDNWIKMLRTTLATVQRDVIQAQTRKYDADVLDGNIGDVYAEMEAAMGPAFQKQLQLKMGGQYFCGIEFNGGADVKWVEKTLDPVTKTVVEEQKSGPCPPVRIDITEINFANAQIQAARDETYVKEQNAKRDKTEAQARVDVANMIRRGGAAAARLQQQNNQLEIEREKTRQVEACAKAGARCTVIVGDPGGVNVNAG